MLTPSYRIRIGWQRPHAAGPPGDCEINRRSGKGNRARSRYRAPSFCRYELSTESFEGIPPFRIGRSTSILVAHVLKERIKRPGKKIGSWEGYK